MLSLKNAIITGAAVLLLPALAPAQVVFKEVSSEKLEGILKDMSITFVKGDIGMGTTFYDYATNKKSLRLWNYSGKDLMLDVIFPTVAWQEINAWNGQAKFSRARLFKDNKGVEKTMLEWNLDLRGGVTEEAIKHFIKSFDVEVAAWGTKGGAGGVGSEDEIYKKVTPERLEKVLSALNLKYKKTAGKGNNIFYYDFDHKNYTYRVINFGGTDLMIDCTYPKATLAKINEWNVSRNFVRAVLYHNNGNPYTALEANLDCAAGTNDAMIRYFITMFYEDAEDFDNYLKGKAGGAGK